MNLEINDGKTIIEGEAIEVFNCEDYSDGNDMIKTNVGDEICYITYNLETDKDVIMRLEKHDERHDNCWACPVHNYSCVGLTCDYTLKSIIENE